MTAAQQQTTLFALADQGTRTDVREQAITALVTQMRRHPRWRADDVADRRVAIDILDLYPGRQDLPQQVAAWRQYSIDKNPGHAPSRTERLRAQLVNWLTPRDQRRRPGQPASAPAGGARPGAGRTRPAPRPAAAFDAYRPPATGGW